MKRIWLGLSVTVLFMLALVSVPAQAATEAEIETSIQNGLVWLDLQQQADGSWQFYDGSFNPDVDVATTALAVLKFEDRAEELGLDPFDPAYEYSQNIIDGLNYIFSHATIDATGVHFGNFYLDVYNTGIAMMPIAASQHPGEVIVGGALNGMTYTSALQGMMDWMAYAQNNFADVGDGGWPYNPIDVPWADNSVSGYATVGVGYANAPPPSGFNLTIPASIITGLNAWTATVQVNGGVFDGGSLYNPYWSPGGPDWINTLKTGNLLYELALIGATVGDPRVTRAVGFIDTYWFNLAGQCDGCGWLGDYQAMFTMMKGLEAYNIDTVGVHDWFDEVSTYIVTNQDVDGFWESTSGELSFGARSINTAFALLTLERAVPQVVEPTLQRMTGGGRVFTDRGKSVTHGFVIHCDPELGPNNLQINWGKGNKFHLDSLTSAACTDDPDISEGNPVAGFDTYKGSGTGRLNGEDGHTIDFVFIDAGEPGKGADLAEMVIDGGATLSVLGFLKSGNQQAHAH